MNTSLCAHVFDVGHGVCVCVCVCVVSLVASGRSLSTCGIKQATVFTSPGYGHGAERGRAHSSDCGSRVRADRGCVCVRSCSPATRGSSHFSSTQAEVVWVNEMFDGVTSSPHEEYEEQHEPDRGTTGSKNFTVILHGLASNLPFTKKLHVANFAEKISRCLMRRWVRELVGPLSLQCSRVRLR